MTEKPLVSVIITTKNEEKNIAACLQSTEAQSYGKEFIESIVVDNNSTDKTKEIAQKFTKNIFNKGNERSMQRNYGAQQAKGKYYMYVDADMILSPTLLAHAVAAMEQGVVALHLRELVLGRKFFSRVRRFERCFYDGTAIDGARFFDREAFIACGGFDEATFAYGSGEDWDIEIFEAHHKHKIDAPSGTALAIGKAAAKGRGGNIEKLGDYARHGETGEREKGKIGFSVARGGDVVGEHRTVFYGEGERLEINHVATNRALFARGALRAALWTKDQKDGLYSMRDVLGI